MPPLTRQETPVSIHSWWSDSNQGLQGAMFNLHAATKPFMRLMYHRQAVAFIRKNRGSPLSKTILKTYLSYLPRMVVNSPVFDYIVQMPGSSESDIGAQTFSSQLIGNLASHEFSIPVILKLRVGQQLISLLHSHLKISDEDYMVVTETIPNVRKRTCDHVGRLASHKFAIEVILKLHLHPCVRLFVSSSTSDEDLEVIEWAMYALTRNAALSDGVQAIVNAKMLDHALELLDSPSPIVQECTYRLVGRLATHESTAPAVVDLKPCLWLVTLLRDEDLQVIQWVLYALSQLATGSSDSAQALVDAKMLDHVLELLDSPSPIVRECTCRLLVTLLRDEDLHVIQWVLCALSQIATSSDSAQVIVDAKMLDHVLELLDSPSLIV
ncbi:armadillo-type protein [Mycena capillaripes]|nr:armadillo-type protein [Mycena capillaripes]